MFLDSLDHFNGLAVDMGIAPQQLPLNVNGIEAGQTVELPFDLVVREF